MRHISLGLVAAFALSACGSGTVDQKNYPVQLYPSDNGGQELFDQARVYCQDSQDCPGAVGLLAFTTSEGAGMCTTFLIAPDLMMTNSHCISTEARKSPNTVSKSMKVLFPSTNLLPGETVAVSEVVKFSDINLRDDQTVGKKPDYALLRLERRITDRTPLGLSQDGIPEAFDFKIFSVTPQSKSQVLGALEVKKCQSMMSSGVQPSYNSPYTSVVSFSDCVIKHGNSGSPMVDDQMKARGIIHAGADGLDQIAQALEIPRVDPLNLGTNMACVALPGILSVNQAECSNSPPDIGLLDGIKKALSQMSEEQFQKLTEVKLSAVLAEWIRYDSGSNPFDWMLSQNTGGSNATFTPVPKCFVRSQVRASMDSFDTVYTPKWTVKPNFDSKLRVVPTVTKEWGATNLKFDPKSLLAHESTNVDFSNDGMGTHQHSNLKYCQ